MHRSGFHDHLGADHFFLSTHEAVDQAQAILHDAEVRLDLPPEVSVEEPVEESL
jgi:hypothetical protein